MIYGYARVSTDGQSADAQRAELEAAGAAKVFAETASGTRTNRPQLARAIKALDRGDMLIVTRLDRLARSTRDLLNTLDAITKRGAAFRSLRDPWADTTTAHGRLMVTVLGGLAEFERELILSRTAEGRARAVAHGVKLGRKMVLAPEQRAWVAAERAKGESVRHLARILGVSKATIGRIPARDNLASQIDVTAMKE
jgi:DNA invertase Pin-like site-specific DNA recombinase